MATAQVAHFVLPQPTNPTQGQNKKSHFLHRFISTFDFVLKTNLYA